MIDFQPKNILVIRLSAIGDVIMASALIPALRNTFPEARLAWFTEDTCADLLRDHPGLDRVLVWPRRRWRRLCSEGRYRELWREFRQLLRELKQARFDLVLDTQGLLKSGLWAWATRAKTRIGLGSREGSQQLMTKTLDRRSKTPRIGGEYFKLAEQLGYGLDEFPMDIQPSGQVRQQAGEILQAAGLGGPFAVFCPFTTRPQKHWFEERWAELARRLAAERGLTVALLGGPADRDAAARIVAQSPGLVNLVGATQLIQCAAIIDQASLLIGVDTGLTHLGTAMKTPTLALFGSTRPYLDTGFAQSKVLYHALPCSPCKRHPSCEGRFDCMQSHTVEHIIAAANLLLETKF